MLNLENLSKKELLRYSILHWIAYSCFMLVIPCSIILVKYGMIGEKVSAITGIGLCILLAFLILGLGTLKKEANKIPMDAQFYKARIKATFNFTFAVALPIVIIVACFLIQENMVLALSTIRLCSWSIMLGALENLILGSSIERENLIREGSARDNEKDKRRDKI